MTMVAGRSQDSLCEASEVHNEIWQMLLVTHYSFTARLAAQGAQCSGWKRRFKKSKDESSTTCSDGFERLHSMAIERRSACRVHTIGDLTRFLYIFSMYLINNGVGTGIMWLIVDVERQLLVQWKWRFKKSEDESSTAWDGFERLHSMAIIARRSTCSVITIGDLTRFLYIFFYMPNHSDTRNFNNQFDSWISIHSSSTYFLHNNMQLTKISLIILFK